MRRPSWAGPVALAITCGFACSKPRPAPAKIDFRVAFEAPRPQTTAVKMPTGETLYAEAEPFVTEREIRSARVLRSDGRPVLGISFDAEGARILARVSAANVGNYALVSLDNSPAVALKLVGPIPDGWAAVEGLPYGDDALESLAARLRGR